MGDLRKSAHAQAAQFERTEALLGGAALEKLSKAHVVVFGVGGVGSHCVLALARAGVGRLTLVDGDTVALSNINRQAIAFHSTLGKCKVDVAADMVRDINPACVVETHHLMVRAQDVESLMDKLAQPVDYVVDAIDSLQTKVALAVYAHDHVLPLITCAGTAGKLDAQAFCFADIYQTTECPLCRRMRSALRKAGVERLDVLYSTEKPHSRPNVERKEAAEGSAADSYMEAEEACTAAGKSHMGDAESCADTRADSVQQVRPVLGTVSYVPSVAGLLLAGHVIKRLTGRL